MENWILKTLIPVIILVLGCSSDKAVKPPSAESLKVKDAIEILSILDKAYEDEDSGTFMRHVSNDPSSDYNSLERKIKMDFGIFEKISLNLIPRWVRFREDLLQLSVQWEGNGMTGQERREGTGEMVSFPSRMWENLSL